MFTRKYTTAFLTVKHNRYEYIKFNDNFNGFLKSIEKTKLFRNRNHLELTVWFDCVFWDPTVFDIVNCYWCSCHFNSFHSSKYVFLAFVHNSSSVFIVTSIIRLIFGHANQPRYRLVSAHKATDTLILYDFFSCSFFYLAFV